MSTKSFFCCFWYQTSSIYTRVNACFQTYERILFPIFINKWPAASVHLNRKLYQEICSTDHISPFDFMLGTINRCNTEARCPKWWWRHHETCWEQSSDGYVERPFCFTCQKRYGWPRHAPFLCAPHQMQRERKPGYIIHRAAQFSCHS